MQIKKIPKIVPYFVEKFIIVNEHFDSYQTVKYH